MRFNTKLLAKTLLCAAVATTAGAAVPPAKPTGTYGTAGITSTGNFNLGVSINSGASHQSNDGSKSYSSVPFETPAIIDMVIKPLSADIGKDASIYVVVCTGGKCYQWTATGMKQWSLGSDGVGALEPYLIATLEASHHIQTEDLGAALSSIGVSLAGKQTNIQVGYMADGGDLHYSTRSTSRYDSEPSSVCPDGSAPVDGVNKPLCEIGGTYLSDVHLTNNFEYSLTSVAYFGGDNSNNVTLTVDPGVTIYGVGGQVALTLMRGSKAFINGTPAHPVVMTAAEDATGDVDTTSRSLWGGLVLNGNAVINGCSEGVAVCEALSEGVTATYGGNDDHDSSGAMTYFQVKYAGYAFNAEDELNGIAFQGVGDGTLVDYVQVYNGSDDGIEFFGGTVGLKHVLVVGASDDSIDWTKGYRGKIQHAVIVQTDQGDKMFEMDNNGSANDALPRAKPYIANVTALGSATGAAKGGLKIREGTGAKFYNMIIQRQTTAVCFDIDHDSTYTNAGTPSALTGNLTIESSVAYCTDGGEAVLGKDSSSDPWTESDWFNAQANNFEENLDFGITGDTDYVTESSARFLNPAATKTAVDVHTVDSWFDSVDYIGGVDSDANDWASASWTFWPAE